MGRRKQEFPKPTIHKPSGQERIRITLPNGKKKDIYLGPKGSAEARRRYAEEFAKWENGEYE